MAGVFKGSLKLDRVVGIRPDSSVKVHQLKLKEDTTSKPAIKKSMKNTANMRNGARY